MKQVIKMSMGGMHFCRASGGLSTAVVKRVRVMPGCGQLMPGILWEHAHPCGDQQLAQERRRSQPHPGYRVLCSVQLQPQTARSFTATASGEAATALSGPLSLHVSLSPPHPAPGSPMSVCLSVCLPLSLCHCL